MRHHTEFHGSLSTTDKLWQFKGFLNGGSKPSWIVKNLIFQTVSTVQRVNVDHHAEVCGDWSNCC